MTHRRALHSKDGVTHCLELNLDMHAPPRDRYCGGMPVLQVFEWPCA
jgi:hypothetical protein